MHCISAPPLPTSHGDVYSSIYRKSPGTGDCHLYGESMGNCLRYHVLWFQFALKIDYTTVTRVSLHKEHTLIKWTPLLLILEKGGPARYITADYTLDIDINIDIGNIYSTYSNRLHIIKFLCNIIIQSRRQDKVKVEELTLYVRRPQLSPFLGAYAEATYKKGGRERENWSYSRNLKI